MSARVRVVCPLINIRPQMPVYKPKFDIRKYRDNVPADDCPADVDEPVYNVSLEPYVPEKKLQQSIPLHTRLVNSFGAMTAEPLKPAVVFNTQGTQTDPVVVSAVPAAEEWHMPSVPYKRPEAAELLSENIRLQREVDALELRAEELRLAYEKISLDQQNARAAEELRLAQDKMHLEQLNARAADELRLQQLNMRRLRENETRPKLPQLAREQPAQPAQPGKSGRPAKPAQPAQPPARSRTFNRK
jgi:hypothetical protein